MMFRCYECGNLFEDGEQAVWRAMKLTALTPRRMRCGAVVLFAMEHTSKSTSATDAASGTQETSYITDGVKNVCARP